MTEYLQTSSNAIGIVVVVGLGLAAIGMIIFGILEYKYGGDDD